MNKRFNCQVTLSKRMRQLIGDKEASLTLVVQPITNGKGAGVLSVSVPGSMQMPSDFLGKETSIIITAINTADDIQEVNRPVGNIFSDVQPDIVSAGPRTPVDKIAAIEVAAEVGQSVVPPQEVAIPAEFSELKDAACRQYVTELNGLIEAVNKAKDKNSGIDPATIVDQRKRALAMEEKNLREAIDCDAFVVNTKYSNIQINDLDLSLGLNQPYNLSNLSAKRVAQSNTLFNLLRSGEIELVSPHKAHEIRQQGLLAEEQQSGMGVPDVFDNHETAAAAIEQKGMGVSPDMATTINLGFSGPETDVTDTDQLIAATGIGTALNQGTSSNITRRTFHSGSQQTGFTLSEQTADLTSLSGSRRIPDESKVNNAGIKTISRK
jgi:hypothetical protein